MTQHIEPQRMRRAGSLLRTFPGRAALVLLLSSVAAATIVRDGDEPPARQAAANNTAPKDAPVILLTGFEPFGQPRSPNPSWEGIKALDGRAWNGHRLVARQMQCVWGKPLEQLETWSGELKPVAIFSFGQGMPNTFAIESRASNRRGTSPDNAGKRPEEAHVVGGGPDELKATVNYDKLAKALAEKGYAVQVSNRAGRYLCEEALYSLEYLKSTRYPDTPVMFCHVPPLESRIRNTPVTAEYVQEFVMSLLDAWQLISKETATDTGRAPADSDDPRHREVREFIDRYFRTWSSQDLDGYGDCFLPKATIHFIESDGEVYSFARAQFLANQREHHRRAPHRAVEVAERVDIRFESQLARAVVFWRLTAGPRVETGYDHFTLLKHGGKWRILNLVFYKADE